MTRNPLEQDRWSVEGEPEHGTVPLSHIHRLDRARSAIEMIVRIVANGVDEDEAGVVPLSGYTIQCLLGGVESLCDNMHNLTEEMRERASMIRRFEAKEGVE